MPDVSPSRHENGILDYVLSDEAVRKLELCISQSPMSGSRPCVHYISPSSTRQPHAAAAAGSATPAAVVRFHDNATFHLGRFRRPKQLPVGWSVGLLSEATSVGTTTNCPLDLKTGWTGITCRHNSLAVSESSVSAVCRSLLLVSFFLFRAFPIFVRFC